MTLELGGKSPTIIFDDADLEQAVKWASHGILCVSVFLFWENPDVLGVCVALIWVSILSSGLEWRAGPDISAAIERPGVHGRL